MVTVAAGASGLVFEHEMYQVAHETPRKQSSASARAEPQHWAIEL
jgi:hypothetical protein